MSCRAKVTVDVIIIIITLKGIECLSSLERMLRAVLFLAGLALAPYHLTASQPAQSARHKVSEWMEITDNRVNLDSCVLSTAPRAIPEESYWWGWYDTIIASERVGDYRASYHNVKELPINKRSTKNVPLEIFN